MKKDWYKTAYYRNVIDMHIPDWDEEFLSQFDSEKYVKMLVKTKADSVIVYAQSHIGLCFYPTEIGEMHRGLRGRDIFNEVIELCHKNNINVVAYYSLIFNNWAYENNPNWRIIRQNMRESGESRRYKHCCPNSEGYRNFVVKQISEICKKYDFEGIRFDMTFWPDLVCYCSSCSEKYKREKGLELPRTVNWEEPLWVGFQRSREEWLNDFASLASSAVNKFKPDISIEHQASGITQSWRWGVNIGLTKHVDFLQGDFYGDALEALFISKFFYSLTPNKPYGFETSSNISLGDHTTMKSKDLLKTKIHLAQANGGAFVFIDAIDPIGTLNENVYSKMGELFEETRVYDKYRGGEMCQDVAIYFSTESKFDFEDNQKDITQASVNLPHLEAVLGATKTLISNHIPFGIITKNNLHILSNYKILILPNVLMMDEDEVSAIKSFVSAGGSLYASKYSSLVTKKGIKNSNFMLAELFGASYRGITKENFTFISPVGEGRKILEGCSEKYPMSVHGSQTRVYAKDCVDVYGTTVLPYSNPIDITRFSSIHSNPPGILTNEPAILFNTYGKGKVVYSTADIERMSFHSQHFIKIVKLLANEPFLFESDAHKSVDITAFYQADKKRYIINLLNFQKEMPNIPINNINIKFNTKGKKVKNLLNLPQEAQIEFESGDNFIKFVAPKLDIFLSFALNLE